MPRSEQEQRQWNEQCYGCQPEDFLQSVQESITFKVSGPTMCIMSILSDAQELIEHGSKNEARQYINRAKHLLMHFHPDKLTR